MNAEKSLQIKVFGRVQGVSFRYFTQRKALELGLRGFVENLPDGSVYIEAAGEPQQVDRFVAYCRQGPSMAEVHKVEMAETEVPDAIGFSIRY